MQLIKASFLVVLATAIMLSTPSWAEDTPDYVPDKLQEVETKKDGWYPMLKASTTFAFNDNRNVVGTDDGSSYTFGLLINGGLDFFKGPHVMSNILKWQLTYTSTPVIDGFIKSADNLEVASSYLYKIPSMDWLGPFATLKMTTSVFTGYLIRPDETTVLTLDKEGTQIDSEVLAPQDELKLTTYWSPTTLRESIGFFADALSEKLIELQFRLGVGAWEVFVRDGYVVADNADTPELEIQEMQDSVQLGGELQVTAKGVYQKLITYGAKLELMQPFYHTADTDLEGLDLLNIETELTIGVKLTEWASLDYALKAYKLPLVVDDWQVTNALLLSLTASII